MGRIAKAVGDHPWIATASIAAFVSAQAALTTRGAIPNIWLALSGLTPDAQISVHLGLAGVAAVTAGFAGVVVVFVLQSSSSRFRDFRLGAPGAVRRTSISIVATPMTVALLGLAGALFAALGRPAPASWCLELGLLLLLHGYVRMLSFFKSMMRLVLIDDSAEARDERQRSAGIRLVRRRDNSA